MVVENHTEGGFCNKTAYLWERAGPPKRAPIAVIPYTFGNWALSHTAGRRKLLVAADCRNTKGRPMASAESTTARLEARIPQQLHALLKRAAEMQGRTITDFVIQAVQQAAENAIERSTVIRMTLEDQECFAAAILSPPPVAPALLRAFERRRKLLDLK